MNFITKPFIRSSSKYRICIYVLSSIETSPRQTIIFSEIRVPLFAFTCYPLTDASSVRNESCILLFLCPSAQFIHAKENVRLFLLLNLLNIMYSCNYTHISLQVFHRSQINNATTLRYPPNFPSFITKLQMTDSDLPLSRFFKN